MRLQARDGIADAAERDGLASAQLHGTNPPTDHDGSGDRILTNVPLPQGSVVVSGGSDRGAFAVQCVRWRARSWAAVVSRVIEMQSERFQTPIAASPWAPGPWGGDSTLSKDFDPGLPPEANPA